MLRDTDVQKSGTLLGNLACETLLTKQHDCNLILQRRMIQTLWQMHRLFSVHASCQQN